MPPQALIQPGLTGAALAARCCFTPAFAVLLGALGLLVLLVFAVMALYDRRRRHRE